MEDIVSKVRSVAAGIRSNFFALNFGPLKAESNRVIAPVANSSASAASKLRQMLFEALRFQNTSTVVRAERLQTVTFPRRVFFSVVVVFGSLSAQSAVLFLASGCSPAPD